jgi:hypothetical protein
MLAKITLRAIGPEEAKHVAKCIIEALSGAGLRIVPTNDD